MKVDVTGSFPIDPAVREPAEPQQRIALGLLAFLFIVSSYYRARSLSITMDEAYTYLSFVAPPLNQILTTYSPNHHVLYSLLAKASVGLFGVSELALRIPSLLGCLICFGMLFQLSRRLFGRGWMMLLSVTLVALNPMILDYMSQARGYGLALGFYLGAILLMDRGALRPWMAGAALGLSLASNLTFGIPVAALDLLVVVALFRKAAGTRWKTAAWLLIPQLALTGAITGGPLLHASRESFIGGYDSVFLTLDNFAISCVMHDWDGNGLWTNRFDAGSAALLYPAFRVAFYVTLAILTSLFAGWLRRRIFNIASNGFRLYLFGGSLALAAFMLIGVHHLFGAPYPFGRMVMYGWPLMTFTMCLLIKRLKSGPAPSRSLAALYVAFCVAMAVQSGMQFTVNHFGWLGYAAGTRQIADLIRKNPVASGRELNITVSGPLYPSLDFYREMYRIDGWKLAVFPASTLGDYIVMDVFDAPSGLPREFQQLWKDPVSKAVVAVRLSQ